MTTRRRRPALEQFQRDSYMASRAAGDVNAARRGRLLPHLAKRVVHRHIIGLLRRGRLW